MTQAAMGEIAYTPESINQQLLLGTSREELAETFNHKNYRTLDVFMRRKGYTWDRDQQVYVIKGIKPKGEMEKTPTTKKLQQALKLFDEGKDPREVARQLGFKSHLALANYLKEKGYLWNHHTQRYEEQVGEIKEAAEPEKKADTLSGNGNGNGNGNGERELLQVLLQNKDQLAKLLQLEDHKNLPRYSLAGLRVSKTLQLSNKLNELIKEFTELKNINHREFFEIAAIETMIKYGYEAEVKGVLE